jgi:hypothetical protein
MAERKAMDEDDREAVAWALVNIPDRNPIDVCTDHARGPCGVFLHSLE